MLCAGSGGHFPPVSSNLQQQGTTGRLDSQVASRDKTESWRILHNADIHVTQEEACFASCGCRGLIGDMIELVCMAA